MFFGKMCCYGPWVWNLRLKYFHFRMAAIFICALVCADAFVDKAFNAFLIDYVDFFWKKKVTGVPEPEEGSLLNATILVNGFHGVKMFMSIILDFIATDLIGNFLVLVSTFPTSILGLLLLWLSKFHFTEKLGNRIFYPAILSLAIGTAGLFAALNQFLVDQFQEPVSGTEDKTDYQFSRQHKSNLAGTINIQISQEETSNVDANQTDDDEFSQRKKLEEYEEKIKTKAKVWKYPLIFLGSITAAILTSSFNKWKQRMIVSIVFMLVAYLFFCCGTLYYNRIKPTRKTLCSHLKELRSVLKLAPLWTVFIVYSIMDAAGRTFFIKQGDRLDRSINIGTISLTLPEKNPLISFYLLQTFTCFITSQFSDFLIKKWFSSKLSTRQFATSVRIGIGMLFASGCCMMARWVEVRRMKFYNEPPPPEVDFPMKITWLLPQFILLGIVQGLVGEGRTGFFYDRVPITMRRSEFPFNTIVLGIGKLLAAFSVLVAPSWIGHTLYTSRVDKYLLVLAILCFSTLLAFIFLSYISDWNIKSTTGEVVCSSALASKTTSNNKIHSQADDDITNSA